MVYSESDCRHRIEYGLRDILVPHCHRQQYQVYQVGLSYSVVGATLVEQW